MQAQREALQQELHKLQAEMERASQSVSALRGQASQERQDLDALHRERAAEQREVDRLHAAQAKAAAAQVALAQATPQPPPAQPQSPQSPAAQPQSPASPPSQQSTLQTAPQAPSAPQAQSASAAPPPPQQASPPQGANPPQARAAAPGQMAEAEAQDLPLPPPPAPPAPPLPPRPRALAQAGIAPPVTRSEPLPGSVYGQQTDQANNQALQSVLERLRQRREEGAEQSPSPPPSMAAPPEQSRTYAGNAPPPAGPRQRLGLARAALLSGNIGAARQYLEEAQLQLVFRPVTPDSGQVSGSNPVSGDVASALSMLGAGDSNGALEYVDRAMAEVHPASAPQSFGYAGSYGVAQPPQ